MLLIDILSKPIATLCDMFYNIFLSSAYIKYNNQLSSWGGEKSACELCCEGTFTGLKSGEIHSRPQKCENMAKSSLM